MSRRRSSGTGCSIAGVGCLLLVGFVALSGFLVCGGFGTSVWQAMPRVVEVEPPRRIPGTPPAPPAPPELFDIELPPEPRPVRPRRPRPVRPRPVSAPEPDVSESEVGESAVGEPAPTEIVEPGNETRLGAEISVSGDATALVAIDKGGTEHPLPGELMRGAYDLQVTFGEQAPFVAGTLAVLDKTPQSVVCKASLGICKVR